MKSRRNPVLWAKHLPHAAGALKTGAFVRFLPTKGFGKFIWRLPALNASAFAIFAASISTDDAVWVNRNATFYAGELGVRQYYWLPIFEHFLLIGFSCFAWLVVMELVIHNLMRWTGTRLSLSAAWCTSAILFLDAAALMASSIYLRDAPILVAIPIYFLPLLVLEILVLAVLSALRRRKMTRGAY
jgi:hypothetical protein